MFFICTLDLCLQPVTPAISDSSPVNNIMHKSCCAQMFCWAKASWYITTMYIYIILYIRDGNGEQSNGLRRKVVASDGRKGKKHPEAESFFQIKGMKKKTISGTSSWHTPTMYISEKGIEDSQMAWSGNSLPLVGVRGQSPLSLKAFFKLEVWKKKNDFWHFILFQTATHKILFYCALRPSRWTNLASTKVSIKRLYTPKQQRLHTLPPFFLVRYVCPRGH